MSNHATEPNYYQPKDLNAASYVYVKIENPDNLARKFLGPYVIVDRPSNTTVTIRVGYDKRGLPRLETHSWDNLRVAHLRPDAQVAVRPDRGRRPASHPENENNFKMAAKETRILAPHLKTKTNQGDATSNSRITQPFITTDGDQFSNSAESADLGIHPTPPPNYTANDLPDTTGPPAQNPFSQQTSKQFPPQPGTSRQNFVPQPTSTPGPKPVTREPLPREESGGLAPPVTKGAPNNGPPPARPFNSTPAAQPEPGHHVHHDHDYATTRSPQLVDHNYFRPLPEPAVRPPPGFENYQPGRPVRKKSLPTKYADYDLN